MLCLFRYLVIDKKAGIVYNQGTGEVQKMKKTKSVENTGGYGECESCVYFDFDEVYGDNVCTLSLDEDEEVKLRTEGSRYCRYYRKYDEYKSVQKQN